MMPHTLFYLARNGGDLSYAAVWAFVVFVRMTALPRFWPYICVPMGSVTCVAMPHTQNYVSGLV